MYASNSVYSCQLVTSLSGLHLKTRRKIFVLLSATRRQVSSKNESFKGSFMQSLSMVASFISAMRGLLGSTAWLPELFLTGGPPISVSSSDGNAGSCESCGRPSCSVVFRGNFG